jgi:cell division protein FtsL
MTKLNALLALAVVASSLYLVKTSHDSRQLFAAVDRARTEEARLDADLKRLEAEREQQATTQRVERHARERLHMRPAHPAVTQYVQDPAGGGTATAAASPRAGTAQPASPHGSTR